MNPCPTCGALYWICNNTFLANTTWPLSSVLRLSPPNTTSHYFCLTHINFEPHALHTIFPFNYPFLQKLQGYNNSIGRPALNSLDKASSTMTNNNGLRTDPWCIPTFSLKPLLSLPFSLTYVIASSYIDLITDTIHTSSPGKTGLTPGAFKSGCVLYSWQPKAVGGSSLTRASMENRL